MEKIKMIAIQRNYKIPNASDPSLVGLITVTARFTLPIPVALQGNASKELAESYMNLFSIEEIVDGNTNLVFYADVTSNIYKDGNISNGLITEADIKGMLEAKYSEYEYKLSQFQLMPFDGIIGQAWNGSEWITAQPIP